MEEIFVIYPWIKIALQLLLAAALGGFLGVERNYVGKDAGTRTFALISLGACLFTIISFTSFSSVGALEGISFDPSRIAAQIVSGIGFIGMAVIFRRGGDLEGATTAASIWVSAAIGMAVGVGFYVAAICATVLTFLIQGILRGLNLEEKLENWHNQREKNAKKS
jgi:putative Mg2+ transporter-C (MgtC) family protein